MLLVSAPHFTQAASEHSEVNSSRSKEKLMNRLASRKNKASLMIRFFLALQKK